MVLEDKFSMASRGNDHGGDLAELKVKDRAKFLSQPSKGAVGHVCEEV